MDQKQIATHMLAFNKTLFDNTFNAMIMMQEQTEKNVCGFFEKAPWFPAEGKKAISDWMNSCKKGRDDFRAAAETSYEKVADYFTNPQKQETTKPDK